MSSVADSITQSLNEALAYAKGEYVEGLKVHRISIDDIASFTPEEIKQIRLAADMSQWLFAQIVGVKQKTVVLWEAGRRIPSRPARRIIGLLKKNPHFAEDVGIYTSEHIEY